MGRVAGCVTTSRTHEVPGQEAHLHPVKALTRRYGTPSHLQLAPPDYAAFRCVETVGAAGVAPPRVDHCALSVLTSDSSSWANARGVTT